MKQYLESMTVTSWMGNSGDLVLMLQLGKACA